MPYTDAFKIYAAEQRQARAEHHYVPPTLAQVRAVVEAGPPGSAADLQAVLLDALADVQAADQQLDHKYVNDWRAERGIYLVLWFGSGTKLTSPPKGADRPRPARPCSLCVRSA